MLFDLNYQALISLSSLTWYTYEYIESKIQRSYFKKNN